MKDMSKVYFRMTDKELQVLRSKKFVKVQELRAKPKSYLNIQEVKKLSQQIRWIDAVMFSREAQESLF